MTHGEHAMNRNAPAAIQATSRVPLHQWPDGLFEHVTDILARMLVNDYQQHPLTVSSPGGSDRELTNSLKGLKL